MAFQGDFSPLPAGDDAAFYDLLTGSYARLVGATLTDRGAAWLYRDAPFAVLAHDTAPDPIFIYANRAAQACFEYGWDDFLTLPSRLSAEAALQDKRQAALDAVGAHGFVSGYSGVRIARSGRRFRIENTTIWQLIDEDGVYRGQAATFDRWMDIFP